MPSHVADDRFLAGFQYSLEAGPNAMLVVDRGGEVVFVNSRAEQMFGYDRADLTHQQVELLLPVRFRDGHVTLRDHYFSKPTALPMGEGRELLGLRRDGTEFPIEVGLSPIEMEQGTLALCSIVDITDRKRTEQTLNAIHHVHSQFIAGAPAKEVFRALLDALLSVTESEYGFIGEVLQTDDGQPFLKTHAITNVAWSDETRRFYEQNAPQNLEFSDMESLFGRVIHSEEEVISHKPASEPQARRPVAGHPPLNAFLGIPLRSQGELVGMAGIANRAEGLDGLLHQRMQPLVTVCASLMRAHGSEGHRKRTADVLRQMPHVNRVTSMGEIVTAIAHEINQPLGIISNNAHACLRELRDGRFELEDLLESLEDIKDESLRAGEIVRGIARFLSKTPPKKDHVEINNLIREVARLMGHQFQENATSLELELDDHIPHVCGDGVQLQQVLFNLVRNALDAVLESDAIEKKVVIQSRGDAHGIAVCVSDTGIGMAPVDLHRVFEPYFTTKPEGLGMGLNISRSIVRWHGGQLRANPHSGYGMTFEFTLPTKEELESHGL